MIDIPSFFLGIAVSLIIVFLYHIIRISKALENISFKHTTKNKETD